MDSFSGISCYGGVDTVVGAEAFAKSPRVRHNYSPEYYFWKILRKNKGG
jgi:hypothetical protein